MGFFRDLSKFVGSIIFTTALVFAIIMIEIIDFTSYDNFKIISDQLLEESLFSSLDENTLNDLKSFLVFQCSQSNTIDLDVFDNESVTLDCADVMKSDVGELKELVKTALINKLYYKDFNCSFIDCIKSKDPQNLLIVTSNEGNQFYRSLQIYLWVATGVGLVILLMSIETWSGRFKGLGLNLVFTGLPFLFLGYIQSLIIPTIAPEFESSVEPILESVRSSLENRFLIVFIAGIVLLTMGYGLGFYLSKVTGKQK